MTDRRGEKHARATGPGGQTERAHRRDAAPRRAPRPDAGGDQRARVRPGGRAEQPVRRLRGDRQERPGRARRTRADRPDPGRGDAARRPRPGASVRGGAGELRSREARDRARRRGPDPRRRLGDRRRRHDRARRCACPRRAHRSPGRRRLHERPQDRPRARAGDSAGSPSSCSAAHSGRLQHSLVEPLATHVLEQIAVGTLLLGCNGIHPVSGR